MTEREEILEKIKQLSPTDRRNLIIYLDREEKAGGIESYFTSPLALREQYKKETGRKHETTMRHTNGLPVTFPTSHYAHWLESKLCNLKGS